MAHCSPMRWSDGAWAAAGEAHSSMAAIPAASGARRGGIAGSASHRRRVHGITRAG